MTTFDISTLTPNTIQTLVAALNAARGADKTARLNLHWGEVLRTSLEVGRFAAHEGAAGWHDSGGIFVKHFGKSQNVHLHRGGIPGTIIHEWAHVIQWAASGSGIGEWYWGYENPGQDLLYEKWAEKLKGCYAASKPKEMAAEAYRALRGFTDLRDFWPEGFLEDWESFFLGDECFQHFV